MIKGNHVIILWIFDLLWLCSCQPKHEILDTSPKKQLQFSTDSLFFDTLLTSTKSITKRLMVYNPNQKAVKISEISIPEPLNPFQLTINGETKKRFENIIILGKDSLRIFVETNIKKTNESLPFLVHDSIQFTLNHQNQFVNLVGWGQNAHFIRNTIITKNTLWEGAKPYVIYGNLLVDNLATLVIAEGVNVYMSYKSALYVKGSLKILGSDSQPVTIQNTRKDNDFRNAFGQWIGIYLLQSSSNHEVRNLKLRNAVFGFRVGSPDSDNVPDITLKNTVIENMQTYGVVGITSDIYAENCLISHCIEGAFAGLAGGNYRLRHCTLSNEGVPFFRESPVATFSNFISNNEQKVFSPEDTFVDLENCIIWGNLENEIQFVKKGTRALNYRLAYNLLKTTLNTPSTNLVNQNPLFKHPIGYNFQLDTLSPAQNNGVRSEIVRDLIHHKRDHQPDIGAYERIE